LKADLHCHSHYSDGRESPAALVARARAAGIDVLALTDHDTLAGLPEAAAVKQVGIELVPGIEFSAFVKPVEVHIVGLWIDPQSPALIEAVSGYDQMRRRRAERMAEKIRALGVPLEFERVLAVHRKGVFGRPHVAQALKEMGAVATFQDAFKQFIGRDAPAYVRKEMLDAPAVIGAIHSAGGVAVLAHGLVGGPDRPHVEALAEMGIDAVEVVHPKLTTEQSRWLREFAAKKGLLVSGGSDWHGEGWSEGRIGDWTVGEEEVRALRQRRRGQAPKPLETRKD